MTTDGAMTFVGTDAAEELGADGVGGITATMGGGDDSVAGTDADDVIDAGAGLDVVDGRGGNDRCTAAEVVKACEVLSRRARTAPGCVGRPATIVGTNGDDRVEGTPGPDVIAGLAGDDRIDGLAGDDVVCGGPGDDELTSYDVSGDVLVGGSGDDFVGSFENPLARVRTGTGDDDVSVAIGLARGWLLDGGSGHDKVYLNLTRELFDAGPMPGTLDLRRGRLAVGPPGRRVTGTFAGWEDLDLPMHVRWRATGTGADERWFFEGLQGIQVWTRGGDDEVFGTPGDDVVVTGKGEDTVTAYGGQDVCRGAERTRGCEARSR